ncbi:MAG: zinc ABC transporter substrate-binding protein [Actinobacteria bacterium]|nr:zinc ABC transporter substrate-binding protein [Actinomycetota bacterium]
MGSGLRALEKTGAQQGPGRTRRRSYPTAGSVILAVLLVSVALFGCSGEDATGGDDGRPLVVADTTFMADIVRNVAGGRVEVEAVLPAGTDPHSFEPTPQDAKRLIDALAVVINITGLVPQLDDLLAGTDDPDLTVIEAAKGIEGSSEDPHTWLDPNLVVGYVSNIASGLAGLDPAGVDDYRANADQYAQILRDLDRWIADQVETIPEERRLLVTNHESLNYFADRYGFRIVGTVFPTVSGVGSPSAQQIAGLVTDIRKSGAPAIFLETGSNADLASQVAAETGAEVVTNLCIASLDENTPTYVEMMRWNVGLIAEALRSGKR